jgi:hypothetical protein
VQNGYAYLTGCGKSPARVFAALFRRLFVALRLQCAVALRPDRSSLRRKIAREYAARYFLHRSLLGVGWDQIDGIMDYALLSEFSYLAMGGGEKTWNAGS